MKRYIVIVAVALLASACAANPFAKSASNPHACPDLVVKAVVTNAAVKGMWNCLDTTLQNNLHAFGVEGDGAFADGSGKAPSIVSQSYVGRANGVDVYTVVVKASDGTLQTFVIAVWTDAAGKVSNLNVTTGAF